MNNHKASNYETQSRYQLVRQASALLRENGLSIFGRPTSRENWPQYQFEQGMQRGAYCSRRKR